MNGISTPCTVANSYAFDNAPRCGAKTRRNHGAPCRSPAVRGSKRCRMHGGKGSGAPKGNLNALKHGYMTKDAKSFRERVKAAMRASKQIAEIFSK